MPRHFDQKAGDLPLPFAAFTDRLKRMGFTIGVDHHLRLQAVLRAFGPSSDLRDLKHRLCPIFAVSRRQQEQFYQVFDRFFHLPEAADGADLPADAREADEDAPEPVRAKKAPYLVAAALWIILIWIVAYQWSPPVAVRKAETVIKEEPGGEPAGTPDPAQVKREPDIRVEIPLKTRAPEITLHQKYGHAIRWTAVLAPLILGLLWEWRRIARRRWAVQRGRGRPPAHYLPVETEPPAPEFLRDSRFYNAARLMRRRVAFEGRRLDIPRTVDQTLKHCGFPRLAYRGLTRPPEYLFLIDLSTYDDHYARLCGTFSDALKREGVFVTRLFYARDPRVCFFTEEGERRYLSDLIPRYDRHRLILAGDGESLLDPVSGRPDRWSRLFRAWEDRALLTYSPPSRWGMREAALAGEFVLLPATLAGLEAVVRYFETPLRYQIGTWAKSDGGAVPPADFDSVDSVDLDALEAYMGSREDFLWLAACAVYTHLNWGLTLRLAMDLNHGITAEALVKLVRLPWFREGAMPDDLRRRLIARMPEQTLKTARQSLLSTFEENLETGETELPAEQRLLIFLHRWMVAGDKRGHLKETRKLIDRVGEERILEDHTLLDVLSSEKASPLAFVLPERWHRFFFRKGISWFGLRTWVRMAAVFMMAVGLAFAVPEPEVPEEVTTVSLAFSFAHIPAGWFMMGQSEQERNELIRSLGEEYYKRYYSDELPRHRVDFEKGFYLQTTEVTQGQWKAVMGENPSHFKKCGKDGNDCPVESVSWEDVHAFIRKLNELEGTDKYRLPTEAEWEYAARAGTETALYNGPIKIIGVNNAPALDEIAWYGGNSGIEYDGAYDCSDWSEKQYDSQRCGTHPVKGKKPNPWGLYDMIGNVWEWCEDDWHGSYQGAPVDGSAWVDDPRGGYRVIRGGSWYDNARGCRSAFRDGDAPDDRYHYLGFRLTRSYP